MKKGKLHTHTHTSMYKVYLMIYKTSKQQITCYYIITCSEPTNWHGFEWM